MASNRDILDAQQFTRARLTTAFRSGLPDGRELEPRSSITPLIVGVVITALLIGVALVMRRFAPTLPQDWQNNYVLVIKDTGARYYTIDGVMHPVTNITSAKLLTPAGSFHVAEVPTSTVSGIRRGPQIGLLDAPDDMPLPASLTAGPWTACGLSDAATQTWIGPLPQPFSSTPMALVSNAGVTYLVAGGMRLPLSPASQQATITALGLVGAAIHPVRADWLNLLSPADGLGPLTIPHAGQPAPGLPAALATAVIGSLVEVPRDDGTVAHYVVSDAGRLVELTPVGYALYQVGTGAIETTVGRPIQTTLGQIASLVTNNTGIIPLSWPARIDTVATAAQFPCLTLDLTGSTPAVTHGAATDPPVSATGEAIIPGGSGALIRVSTGGTLGSLRFIADNGLAYGLGEPQADTLARLGYTADNVTVMPQPWAALVPPKNPDAPVLSPGTVQATVP